MAEVAIIIPVLRRPHRVEPMMRDVAAAMTCDYELLFVATPGDKLEIAALERAGANFILTPRVFLRGDYPVKINLGYRTTTAPWILTGADDLHFHPGWFEEAMKVYQETGALWIGTNDLSGREIYGEPHATHSLVHRNYARDQGTVTEKDAIYSVAYWHEFVDDEACATARHRGVYAWAENSIVEHMHPHWGKAPSDELYEKNKAARIHQGRIVYNRRKRLWAS